MNTRTCTTERLLLRSLIQVAPRRGNTRLSAWGHDGDLVEDWFAAGDELTYDELDLEDLTDGTARCIRLQ